MSDTCPCPACGRLLRLPEHVAGQEARCPSCGEVFRPRGDDPTRPTEAIQTNLPAPHLPTNEGRYQDNPPCPPGPQRPWDEDYPPSRPVLARPLPGRWLGKALVGLLELNVLYSVLCLGMGVAVLAAPPRPWIASERNDLLACVGAFLTVPTALVFCLWMQHSYLNLIEMGVGGLRYSPGWAAGSFFVPILNLYQPYQIAQEMWRASSTAPSEGRTTWHDTPSSPTISFWWLFWLLSNFCSLIVFVPSAPLVDTHTTLIRMLADVFSANAALCAILMIQGLRARQEKKLEWLRSAL